MSEDTLKEMIARTLADPNFVVRVNQAAMAARQGKPLRVHPLPDKVQQTIDRAMFSTEFIRKHYAHAVRPQKACRESNQDSRHAA